MIRQSLFVFGVAVGVVAIVSFPATAEVALKGSLTATKDCPALQSIKKATNPGDIKLVVGQVYDVIAQNAETATHYRVRVGDAAPPERWVGIDCGTYQGTVAGGGGGSGGAAEAVLALSWQPSFCETHSSKPECAAETAASFEATHFTLHGLWPQPRSR